MNRSLVCTIAGALMISACSTVPEAAPVTPEPGLLQPAPPPLDPGTLPAGSDLVVTLNDSLSSDRSRVGDLFTMSVHTPVLAQNGEVVVPEGSVLTGMVTGVDDSDHVGDQAAIRINFLRISINGVTHPLAADVVEARPDVVRESGVDTERAAVIGGAAGAVLGAVIGGDLRDVLIGGALGAGIGTIISLGTGEHEAVLPEGARMVVRTRDTLALR